MKICESHWRMMRDAIEERGLSGLIAKDGPTAFANEVAQLEAAQVGDPEPHKAAPFDPLMSMHWHFSNEALRCGGLYLLAAPPDGAPDYCPVCEFEKNQAGFVGKDAIGSVADAMRAHAIAEKLISGEQ